MASKKRPGRPTLELKVNPGAGAVRDAALVTRYVRFMDDTFGAGQWERRPGEPPTNDMLRMGMFMAFKAGAGVDQ
jgi:hypothetical protein